MNSELRKEYSSFAHAKLEAQAVHIFGKRWVLLALQFTNQRTSFV
jgi:hypothetical protein